MQQQVLIPHLFRTEYAKIVAVLCRRFGFAQMETAEDIASDTFLTAAQTWALEGVPPNPAAWLHRVAGNKAVNHLRREQLFRQKISLALQKNQPNETNIDIDLSPGNIADSQLQMMFAICNPVIPPEAQIGLSLRILCGFGIDEIAEAFLTSKDTINKRLFRAREKLREQNIVLEMPAPAALGGRLDAVLTTIYLLFSEGYYSVSQQYTLRKELCVEAVQLCYLLLQNEHTNKAEANALMALLCFQSSRLEARTNAQGDVVLYQEQDTHLWNQELIGKGAYYLQQASGGAYVSRYHLEAAIAYWHTQQADSFEKWSAILQLYNHLLQLQYSPIAALNRTYALAKVKGAAAAIAEAEKLQLHNNHFYHLLLGELYAGIDNHQAKLYLQQALALAQSPSDKQTIQKKLQR